MYYLGRDKKQALSAFLLHGGAMNYDDGVFFVGPYEAVEEIIVDTTVRDATERALSLAGASDTMLETLMDGWTQNEHEKCI